MGKGAADFGKNIGKGHLGEAGKSMGKGAGEFGKDVGKGTGTGTKKIGKGVAGLGKKGVKAVSGNKGKESETKTQKETKAQK